jgi:hypothetical protein
LHAVEVPTADLAPELEDDTRCTFVFGDVVRLWVTVRSIANTARTASLPSNGFHTVP